MRLIHIGFRIQEYRNTSTRYGVNHQKTPLSSYQAPVEARVKALILSHNARVSSVIDF